MCLLNINSWDRVSAPHQVCFVLCLPFKSFIFISQHLITCVSRDCRNCHLVRRPTLIHCFVWEWVFSSNLFLFRLLSARRPGLCCQQWPLCPYKLAFQPPRLHCRPPQNASHRGVDSVLQIDSWHAQNDRHSHHLPPSRLCPLNARRWPRKFGH